MTKKEKALRNDILDILEVYSQVIEIAAAGHSVYISKDKASASKKHLKKVVLSLRDATIKIDEDTN